MLNLKKFFTKRLTIIFLILIFMASTWSLYTNQFFRVHDYTHGARIAEMAISLKEGRFPVRWSPNFGFGFGMPLFNFYAPLPYYLGAVLFNLGLPLVLTIKIALYFLPNLLSLIGAFKLGKKAFGRLAGIVLAATYTLAPYRAVNLFVRGALSEIWAMAFLPWVIYAIIKLAEHLKNKQKQKKNYLLLTLSLSGIILSHNLTALMFIPLSALFAFVLFLKNSNFDIKKTFAKLWPVIGIYLLSFMLTAFYVVPSFLEKDFSKIDFIFSGYFEYHHHFLYIRQFFKNNWQYGGSAWGPNDDISFFLGWGQILSIFALTVFFIKYIWQNKNKLKEIATNKKFFYAVIFGFFSILALFMSIMKSKFIWDNFGILQFIQFPWRWLTVASLFIAVLAALSTIFIKKPFYRYIYAVILLILTLFNAVFFRPEKYLEDSNSLYYSDEALIQKEMSAVLPDYIPTQMAEGKVLKELSQKLPQIWLNDEVAIINEFDFHVDRSHEKLLEVNLSEEALLNFKVAYFPGWQAEVDGEIADIVINEEIGNIQVLTPKGSSKVGIYFSENTLARKIGDSFSIAGLIIFFLYFSPFLEKKHKRKSKSKS